MCSRKELPVTLSPRARQDFVDITTKGLYEAKRTGKNRVCAA